MEYRACAVDHKLLWTMSGVSRTEGADSGTSPVAALRRIAFLLERSRAETYKVKAFRAAADTILPLGSTSFIARE